MTYGWTKEDPGKSSRVVDSIAEATAQKYLLQQLELIGCHFITLNYFQTTLS